MQSPRQVGKVRKHERSLLQYTHNAIDYEQLLSKAQMLGDEETQVGLVKKIKEMMAQSKQCFLKNYVNEYEIYHFQFQENDGGSNYLFLTRGELDEENKENHSYDIVYNLGEVHVCTNDNVGNTTYCEKNEFYAVNILHRKSRKIFFDNYNQM